MAAFYTDLSGVYDALFPVSEAQRGMFGRLLETGPVRRVVDAGCGTGAQLLRFARAGASCLGFDPDPSLVAIARDTLAAYPDVRIEEGGFADLSRLASPGADLVLCLGNSLVHVPQEEAARFLADSFALLAAGGRLLFQILNYERLFAHGVTELPLMAAEDGAIEFRRRYLWEGRDRVRFQTTLRIAGAEGPRIVRNDIPLYPLYPDDLWDTLSRCGFREIRYFGDYAGTEFTVESEALVCLAEKG